MSLVNEVFVWLDRSISAAPSNDSPNLSNYQLLQSNRSQRWTKSSLPQIRRSTLLSGVQLTVSSPGLSTVRPIPVNLEFSFPVLPEVPVHYFTAVPVPVHPNGPVPVHPEAPVTEILVEPGLGRLA